MRLCLVAALIALAHARPNRDALCTYGTAMYSINWEYDELSNDVVFRLTATSPAHNFWTGIYFGDAEPFDAIGVFVRNGQIGIVDAHIPKGDEATVVADDQTNVQSLQFDMVEGRLTAEFSRPLSSKDEQDYDLSKCAWFYFPEAEEITSSGQITLPTMSMARRVCDIARNCPARRSAKHDKETKREENKEEAEVAAETPAEETVAIQAQPETELALEKKEAPEAPICNWEQNDAAVNWRLEGDNVIFHVEQPNKKGKWYSVFGIGETMDDIRTVIVFTENGKVKKIGAYETKGHAAPEGLEYEPQLVSASNAKGRSSFEISANKAQLFPNVDFASPVTLQVGLYIGNYAKGFEIKKHDSIPQPIAVSAWDKCAIEKEVKIEEVEASGLEVEGSGEAGTLPEQPKEELLLFNPFAAEENKTEEQKEENTVTETKEEKKEQTPAPAVEEPKAEQKTAPVTEAHKIEQPATEAPKEEVKEEIKAEETKPEEAKVEETKPEETKPEEAKVEETKAEETKAEEPKTEESVEGSGEEEEKKEEKPAEDKKSLAEMEAEIQKVAATTVIVPTTNGVCSSDHKDLKVCSSYFADYIAKVEEWAHNHEQTLGSQMWKACTLLSEVKHVPTMCCTIFHDTCQGHIKFA